MHCIQNSCIGTPSPFNKPIEEINDIDFFSQQPEEIILNIFGYLSAIELTKCDEVSRGWRRLASNATLWNALDLRTIFSSLKVFDELDWVKHVDMSSFGLDGTKGTNLSSFGLGVTDMSSFGIDVTDAPPLDKRQLILFLKRHLPYLSIEGNEGVTLLTIPKGLTFHKLVTLVESFKERNSDPLNAISIESNLWGPIFSKIGDIPVDKTYRIAITNNVLKNSRNLSVDDQNALLSSFGCKMPTLLEATLLIFATFMSSRKRLYNHDPSTYTRCWEPDTGYLFVGCFSPSSFAIYEESLLPYDNSVGVGGVLWKS